MKGDNSLKKARATLPGFFHLQSRAGRLRRPFEENLGEESNSQEKRLFVDIKCTSVQRSDFFPG
jgi:hypothetical protein